ncbi:leucyl/phenylalanyl-tRNA--protein transferase [Roseibacterium sp. SDUM158017]|uniref:leucyl/phenylalanyl-tRNA--protein transferase n=1 Tax=Roseicyclus salinarum TaxID=3036773 RepID=UPI002415411A|nr:leucyl/phenylalanyl-tRNA--protein transferase [Roseibacterium sp. SDUM158017]MDG4648161.1 leucyl/phenylalanyl-tRNA--protein transferase [Roseibacterium sp. SDUM158017]
MAHDVYRLSPPPLSPALMLRAYAAGIFPMSEGADDPTLFWVDPQRRGIFPLDRFHVSHSLARRIRRGGFEVRVDHDFAATVMGCADREPTWINAEIFRCYMALHAMGRAHSIEVWQDGELAGGVFGVVLGGAFFGESMFSRRADASKIALAWLVARLRFGRFQLFDTQFVTEHLESLGAVEIPRAEYREILHAALETEADFLAMPDDLSPQEVLEHLRTHTS